MLIAGLEYALASAGGHKYQPERRLFKLVKLYPFKLFAEGVANGLKISVRMVARDLRKRALNLIYIYSHK